MSIVVLQLPDVKRKQKLARRNVDFARVRPFSAGVRYASRCEIASIGVCKRIATAATSVGARFATTHKT